MKRKEWLENFIRCVDTGASTLDFRRYCRVKAQHLPRHMAQLQSFRDELARLVESEKETTRREQRIASLEEARRTRAEQRAAAIEATRAARESSLVVQDDEVVDRVVEEVETIEDDNNDGE